MPSVKVRDNEPFDVALRRFKRSCEKAGVLSEVRRREHYEKPTAERKRKAAAAVKRHAGAVSWSSQEGCQAAAARWPFVFDCCSSKLSLLKAVAVYDDLIWQWV